MTKKDLIGSRSKPSGSLTTQGRRGHPHSPEFRARVVDQVVRGGASITGIARAFGLSTTTVSEWVSRFRKGGAPALTPKERTPPKRQASTSSRTVRHAAVVRARTAHPEWGTRRVRDVLARFEALGVSETEVRRILHEEGLISEARTRISRERPPRRFERAEPNQLWQSDIFTFLLRRHERVYVAAFMDDHSRFVVSYALAHHQRSDLVMEALRRGLASYGNPREILTDQGRQYTAWRGSTEFEEELRREQIAHVKSRPQHPETIVASPHRPQTLGKIERFWKTLWDEFLSRTVFSDFADCVRRFALYVHAYNFQRPHQALAGLVPADRFFRAVPQMRAAIEQSVAENAHRLSLEQPTRKPFYLVGRLGDRELSIAASGSGLDVRVGEEEPQRIELPKEESHEVIEASRFRGREVDDGISSQEAQSSGAEVADGLERARRDGASSVLDDPERALGRASRDRGDRGARDLAWDLLPAGDARSERDAFGAGPGRGGIVVGHGSVEPGSPHRGARGEGEAARTEQASGRAHAVSDASGAGSRTGDAIEPRPTEEVGGGNRIEARWEHTFAALEDEDEPEQEDDAERLDVDHVDSVDSFADAGWRGRALTWERKLTGANALLVDHEEDQHRTSGEVRDDEADGEAHRSRVHADAADARPGAGPLHRGGEDPRGGLDDQRASARAGTDAHADAIGAASLGRVGDRVTGGQATGTTRHAFVGEEAARGERPSSTTRDEAGEAARRDAVAARDGVAGDEGQSWSDAFARLVEEIERSDDAGERGDDDEH
jgi:transposase InsO family protein